MEDQYQSERTLSKIIVLFTIIAILIACLGLFGLSRFISLIRTKEIGIRKVNGGTLVQMIFLFWKELYGWIAIAFAIACPVSWYVMHRWLENFAYRTPVNWWIFAGAGTGALVIALVTVSWQAYKSASCNPVDALRYE
jgi:putative ABC transport system permease protein